MKQILKVPALPSLVSRIGAAAIDRSRGSILGALIGDATGGTLEFIRDPWPSDIDAALKLPGGGVFELAPGQITDDGELTLCVLRGLANCKNGYDPDIICVEYGRWINSKPFDIGSTTRIALSKAAFMGPKMSKLVTEAALLKADSTSNGSAMKLSPTAIYGSFLPIDHMLRVVETETRHMHHHQEAVDCNKALALAMRSLILGESAKQAYESQRKFALHSSIRSWLTEMEQGDFQVALLNIGWVKIAYQQAMRHLAEETSFHDALKAVVSLGGDTDTNACIVGMLLGARDGESQLDPDLVHRVLTCRTAAGQPRPEWLEPSPAIYALIDQVLDNALAYAKQLEPDKQAL